MEVILQKRLPHAPWMSSATWRLPGLAPLPLEEWISRDDGFAGQMALRDRLIEDRHDEVHGHLPQSIDAQRECLELVLEALRADAGYQTLGETITRPDGVDIAIDRKAPLATVGRLIQPDICLLQPGPDGHELTAAILCFPSNWLLTEKLGRPLGRIHRPVQSYDDAMTKRVQRVFDALQPGQLLWRSNAFLHRDPSLFRPKREADHSQTIPFEDATYVRSERQSFRKLPVTGAVVFTIHTNVVARASLTREQSEALLTSGIEAID